MSAPLYAHFVAPTKRRPGEVRITPNVRPVGGTVFSLGQDDCKRKAHEIAAKLNATPWNF